MSTTDWLFYLNFGVFSVFLALFITELMGAVLLLADYESSRRKVLTHVVPIWEVTGTFAAFWVVTADFAYPSMLIPVAEILAGPIIVFLILLVARNAAISFAEVILKGRWLDEKKLYQAYALATLAIGVVVVMMLSAIVSGAGVDLVGHTFSPGQWVSTAGSLPYLLGVVVIAVGLAPVFYGLEALRRWTVPVTVLGVAIEGGALYLYSPALLSWTYLVPAVLTVAPALLFLRPSTARLVSDKLVFGAWTVAIVFSQSYLVYPTAFGGALPVQEVTATGPMVGAFYLLTVVGALFIGALMVLYLLTVRRAAAMDAAASGTPASPASGAVRRP